MKPIFVWAKFLKRNFCWKQRTHLWAENEPMLIRSRCFWKVSKSVKACASYLYLYISSVSRGRTKRHFCVGRSVESRTRRKWKVEVGPARYPYHPRARQHKSIPFGKAENAREACRLNYCDTRQGEILHLCDRDGERDEDNGERGSFSPHTHF